MRPSRLATLLAVLLALVFAGVAPASAQSPRDPYQRLVDAIASDTISGLVFDRDMQVGFEAGLRMDPEVAANEAECPGLITGLRTAVTPVMRKSHELDYQWYRAELEQLFRRTMSESEAAGAADFFATDLAQRFLATAIAQTSAENALKEALGTDEVTLSEEAYAADKRETTMRTMQAMNPEDLKQFTSRMAEAAWFPTFASIRPQISELGLAMGNRDFTPQHGAEFDEAAEAFSIAHFDKCEAGD
jgi:hypothetical protein